MRYRVAGISFEHMHMGDNLQMVAQHPDCELVGVCDAVPERMQAVIAEHRLQRTRSLPIGSTASSVRGPT